MHDHTTETIEESRQFRNYKLSKGKKTRRKFHRTTKDYINCLLRDTITVQLDAHESDAEATTLSGDYTSQGKKRVRPHVADAVTAQNINLFYYNLNQN